MAGPSPGVGGPGAPSVVDSPGSSLPPAGLWVPVEEENFGGCFLYSLRLFPAANPVAGSTARMEAGAVVVVARCLENLVELQASTRLPQLAPCGKGGAGFFLLNPLTWIGVIGN